MSEPTETFNARDADQGISLDTVLARRNAVTEKVIAALAHLPRERAIATVMSWIMITDLEEAAPTLIGSEPPPTLNQAKAAYLARLSANAKAAGIHIHPQERAGTPPMGVEAIIAIMIDVLWRSM